MCVGFAVHALYIYLHRFTFIYIYLEIKATFLWLFKYFLSTDNFIFSRTILLFRGQSIFWADNYKFSRTHFFFGGQFYIFDCPSNVPDNCPLKVQDPKFLVKDSFRYKKNILFEKKVLFCTFCAQFALCNQVKYFKVSIKY